MSKDISDSATCPHLILCTGRCWKVIVQLDDCRKADWKTLLAIICPYKLLHGPKHDGYLAKIKPVVRTLSMRNLMASRSKVGR